tara:strand:+ start:1005 stop:1637 length:633 start_codon:yes stop_codon:yes gene_type:complete
MSHKILNVDDSFYWDNKYKKNEFSWDIGKPTPYFVNWSKSIKNKAFKHILIPGCGIGHDVIYLSKSGFNVYACDFSSTAIKILSLNNKKNNTSAKLISMDFFDLINEYNNYFDYILEYTFYCAINPNKRNLYIQNCNKLLKRKGKLIGIMLPIGNDEVASNPPFKVTLNELKKKFSTFFKLKNLYPNNLSIKEREGIEYIVEYDKINSNV